MPDEIAPYRATLRRNQSNGGQAPTTAPRAVRFQQIPSEEGDTSAVSMGACLKPILKWAGGKRRLAPRLLEFYAPHRHRVYAEIFAGGLAGAFQLCPAQAYGSDANHHLINFYSWVRDGSQFSMEMRNDEGFFYSTRAEFNEMTRTGKWQGAAGAERFFYLSRTCYNGLVRFNRSGDFNAPFGRYKKINYRPDLREHTRQMRSWTLEARDFRTLPLPSDWFVFADPPYFRTFTGYNPTRFDWAEQVRLADMLAAHAGPVVATNSSEPEVLALYRDREFDIELVPAPRRISCKAGERRDVLEMLATRNV